MAGDRIYVFAERMKYIIASAASVHPELGNYTCVVLCLCVCVHSGNERAPVVRP